VRQRQPQHLRARQQGRVRHDLSAWSVSIAGHVVAYGFDATLDNAETDPSVIYVGVVDLARPSAAVFVARPYPPGAPSGSTLPSAVGKVVRTVGKADGAVAWISCDAGGGRVGFDLAVGRRARCQRPGRQAWVYSANGRDPLGKPTLLDDGRGIAPLSLRLEGPTVRWTDRAAERIAPLV